MLAVLGGLADVERDLIRTRTAQKPKPRQGPRKAHGTAPLPDTGATEEGHSTTRVGRHAAGIGAQGHDFETHCVKVTAWFLELHKACARYSIRISSDPPDTRVSISVGAMSRLCRPGQSIEVTLSCCISTTRLQVRGEPGRSSAPEARMCQSAKGVMSLKIKVGPPQSSIQSRIGYGHRLPDA